MQNAIVVYYYFTGNIVRVGIEINYAQSGNDQHFSLEILEHSDQYLFFSLHITYINILKKNVI